MASRSMALVLALTLWSTAAAAAQAIGPICLRTNLESVAFELFSLPVGGTGNRSQFLLAAVSAGRPFSGAASLEGQTARFTLIAAHPFGIGGGTAAFSGVVDLQTNTGEGVCSAIGAQPGEAPCGAASPITYTVVSCNP